MLNQLAAIGQLRGFALETSGGAPNLAGTYDKAMGVITLPMASFQPSGMVAGDDLKAVVGLQTITVDFAHKTWQDPAGQTHTVNQDMVANLQSTLNGSPVLAEQIKAAVTQGHVQHLSLLGNSMAAGATYDSNTSQQDGTPKGINLPPLGLQTQTATNLQGKYDAQDLTFVLGHEIQHGFNNAAKDQAMRAFMRGIGMQAHVQGPVHDYADELRAYIQAGREDEATAEIAGWNALLSREQRLNTAKSGLDLMADTGNDRTLDFIKRDQTTQTININPGLSFNPDGSLPQTPANIAAMGQHYFDRPSPVHAQPGQRPVRLGEHRPNPTADYTNYYGAWALERIFAAENRANVRYQGAKPQIVIDMAGIGLEEALIEMEGLDLGQNKAARPYLDSSQTPPALHHFDHTQDRSVSPTQDHQYVPVAPSAPSQRRSPEDPDHPENALLEKVRAGVRDLDRQVDKPWDEQSERLSASALAMAVEKEFRPGDEVWVGLNQKTERYAAGELLLVQRMGGNVSADPFQNRAHMPIAEALSQPAEQRYQQVEVMRQTQAEEQQRQRQEALTRSQNPPSQGGPAMSM